MDNSIGFIVGEKAWACSNEVKFDQENELASDKKSSKVINYLKFSTIFEGQGVLTENEVVYCLFRAGDKKEAFKGIVHVKNDKYCSVQIPVRSDKIEAIIQKIKGGKSNEQLLFR